MFGSLGGFFSTDLAIDLGTANTLIYARGAGVVCNEPSVVAVQERSRGGKRQVVAVGAEAKSMLGRTPESIVAVRPLRDGVIQDFEIAETMLRYFIRKSARRSFFRPRVIVCIPRGVTEVEKRAVRDAAVSAGASNVFLIEEPMAAAIGAGLPVTEACGNMVLDIGGGTSEVAVISLKGIVYSESIRIAGDKMDEAIAQHLRRQKNILVGERTAEQVKLAIGSAYATGEELELEIRGRDLVHGVPRSVTVTEEEIRDALIDPLYQMVELVRRSLERTPPELSADISERGLTLTGGGALLRNLDKLLARELSLPVKLADDPISAVVMGSGIVLDRMDVMSDVIQQ